MTGSKIVEGIELVQFEPWFFMFCAAVLPCCIPIAYDLPFSSLQAEIDAGDRGDLSDEQHGHGVRVHAFPFVNDHPGPGRGRKD
jgi:hypothetical protein